MPRDPALLGDPDRIRETSQLLDAYDPWSGPQRARKMDARKIPSLRRGPQACPLLPQPNADGGIDLRLSSALFEAMWERDPRMDAVDWKGRLGMFGYPSHEVGSQLSWWAEHVHPDDRASAVPARIQ